MKHRIEMVKASHHTLGLRSRSLLLGVTRSHVYYQPVVANTLTVTVMNEIRDIYDLRPFQGYRRMTDDLQDKGYVVNHKRIYRLMKMMGLQALYPKKNVSKRRQQDQVFPYMLKDYPPQKPHDCWCVDITYMKIATGFIYLTALIDVVSRCVMGFHISPFLDTESCLLALDMALKTGYTPKIINSDQGCQFTSQAWVWTLVKHRIEISMDGKGRALDNIPIERFWRTIKYEEVYLKTYDSLAEARCEIGQYMSWYNHHRRHSGLSKARPYEVMTGKKKATFWPFQTIDSQEILHMTFAENKSLNQQKNHLTYHSLAA